MCPCGSDIEYKNCCLSYHSGERTAKNSLTLMKSRYAAYVKANADYILKTTIPAKAHLYKKSEILKWAKSSKWLKLEILYFDDETVEFKAHYFNSNMQLEIHHERSRFKNINGTWYYSDAEFF